MEQIVFVELKPDSTLAARDYICNYKPSISRTLIIQPIEKSGKHNRRFLNPSIRVLPQKPITATKTHANDI